MKKTFFSATVLFATMFAITSCKTVIKSHTADYDLMYISKQGILQKPLITDLEVGKQRVTLSQSYNNVSLIEAKENVMGDFIKQQSCDLIVQPYFSSSSISTDTKTTITITLTGYPASYKNIRNFESKDTSLFFPRGFHPGASNNSTLDKLVKPDIAATDKKSNNNVVGAALLGGLFKH